MQCSLQRFSSLGLPEQQSQDDTSEQAFVVGINDTELETALLQHDITNERSFCHNALLFIRENHCVRHLAVIVYGTFLLLQFISLVVVYLPRATVCCIKNKVTSYQCNGSVFIEHDLELELSWITAQGVTGFLCLCVVIKWHGATGMKSILRKLIKLPKFWYIVGMFTVSVCTVAFIMKKTENKTSLLQTAVLHFFACHFLSMAILVPILNYTIIFKICTRKGYSKETRVLVRLTLLLLFLTNAIMFLIGFLQLPFKVSGIDSNAKGTFEFNTVFLAVRDLSDTMFYYTVQSFLWNKLFTDDKNILSHMQSLE
jgi:hypothetical protein